MKSKPHFDTEHPIFGHEVLSQDGVDALRAGQRQELELGAARANFAALPFADKNRAHVQRKGESGLAHVRLLADMPDRLRRERLCRTSKIKVMYAPPLVERKALLKHIVAGIPDLQVNGHEIGDGELVSDMRLWKCLPIRRTDRHLHTRQRRSFEPRRPRRRFLSRCQLPLARSLLRIR